MVFWEKNNSVSKSDGKTILYLTWAEHFFLKGLYALKNIVAKNVT